MATIVYLDVEDEITSAATRIRGAAETRVALVLPFGSRVATSRINFRLLAREAMVNGRRLDIIAPDASARALAASAGLPVFASIGEYETALDRPEDEAPDAGTDAGAAGAGAAAAAAGASIAAGGTSGGPKGGRAFDPSSGAATRAADPGEPGEPVGDLRSSSRGEPRVVHAPRRRRIGAAPLIGFGVLALAVIAAGVAGFTFLPSAEITITPRIEAIGPIPLTVRADPAATAVDTDNAVIPAQNLSIPVESSGEFQATGKRVDETKATGVVQFDSINTVGPVSVPRGTRVSTLDGIVFVTDQAVLLPKAKVTGNRIEHGIASVGVTALKAGTEGNVDAGAISQVPGFLSTQQVSVMNPAATTGGTHTEVPKIVQKDVDAAVAQLRKDLEAKFATALEDPATAPEGTTLFPATAALGEPVPDVAPATLVGQEVASFTLRMTATGQVLAVDASPVKAIAQTKLQGSVGTGYRLVDGSISVTVGEGTVVGGVVTFAAEGSAKQVRELDPAALKRQVLGMAADDARRALAPYGDVGLVLWPEWVSSVPSLDQRVTLTIAAPLDATPSASGSPTPSAASSAAPSAGASAAPSATAP